MFSLVIPLTGDEDDSVRNNAIFALGEIAFYGKTSIYKWVFTFYSSFINIIWNKKIKYFM